MCHLRWLTDWLKTLLDTHATQCGVISNDYIIIQVICKLKYKYFDSYFGEMAKLILCILGTFNVFLRSVDFYEKSPPLDTFIRTIKIFRMVYEWHTVLVKFSLYTCWEKRGKVFNNILCVKLHSLLIDFSLLWDILKAMEFLLSRNISPSCPIER